MLAWHTQPSQQCILLLLLLLLLLLQLALLLLVLLLVRVVVVVARWAAITGVGCRSGTSGIGGTCGSGTVAAWLLWCTAKAVHKCSGLVCPRNALLLLLRHNASLVLLLLLLLLLLLV